MAIFTGEGIESVSGWDRVLVVKIEEKMLVKRDGISGIYVAP